MKALLYGTCAAVVLLGIYFLVLSLVSNWDYAIGQFSHYWYFIAGLAAGFGVQIGLYTYLRKGIAGMGGGGKALGVTGTTSTAAMI